MGTENALPRGEAGESRTCRVTDPMPREDTSTAGAAVQPGYSIHGRRLCTLSHGMGIDSARLVGVIRAVMRQARAGGQQKQLGHFLREGLPQEARGSEGPGYPS